MTRADDTPTTPAEDGFERYYAEKLWEWIPPIYRHEDGLDTHPSPHVLRALVEILAEQAAVARRSVDRLWEDQFIDLCDDWAVPYLADLVGTRLLSNLNRRGRRVDVARTIFYRRRKGTPLVMEALVQDVTGWEGAVVESFRRLARTRHRLDPEPGPLAGPVTGTPPGGTAELRAARGSDVLDGPFDDFAHTPDVRRLRGWKGRYNIPKLNFHLYRLRAYEVESATPVDFGGGRFTFDPSGREIPLFAPDRRFGRTAWTPVEEWQLPAPIPCRLLNRDPGRFVPSALAIVAAADFGGAAPFEPDEVLGGNLRDWSADFSDAGTEVVVDPERGRFLLASEPAEDVEVGVLRYHYGFSGETGAGTYRRPRPRDLEPDGTIPDGGDTPGPVSGFELPANGVHELTTNKTYLPDSPEVSGISALHLRARDGRRPYIEFPGDTMTFRADEDGAARLILDGLWLGFEAVSDSPPVHGTLVLEGVFETVVIRQCTLDPGGLRADGAAIPCVDLEIRGQVAALVVESSITARIRESTDDADPCSVGRITVCDSIVHGGNEGGPAIETRIGEARLERVTAFGDIDVNRLYASETLVAGEVVVTDNQHSCIRFSAARSFTGEHYESHVYPRGVPGHFFTSRRFGDPGYAQLSETAPREIRRGAENRSEIGAFSKLLNPVKADDLEVKVLEYMPFGLIPQFIFET